MKCRVFYRVDGGITIRRGIEKNKLPNETDTEYYDRTMVSRQKLVGATYEDVDSSSIPAYDTKTRNKWRGSKGQGIHIDNNVKTKREKRDEIETELDGELAKSNPDVVKAMRLRRKLDKKEYD